MTREDIEKELQSCLDEPDNEWDSIFNSGFSRGFMKDRLTSPYGTIAQMIFDKKNKLL